MNKKFSDDKIKEDFTGKIDSVRGPPGAPIGFGVHKLASSIDPYSAKKTVEEPEPGIQHQPIILPADHFRGVVAEPEKLSPEMEYRKEVGEKGFRAADATLNKLVAAGMTDTPKVLFNNSILPVKDDAKDDKAADAKVVADPNAGAPEGDKAVSPEKLKKAIEQAAKDAPNPNAAPADPKTDPVAVATAANKMEDSSAKKSAASDAKAAKDAPKAPAAALAQIKDIASGDPTKIDSVRGPPGAPIGFGVHKLSSIDPYAAKQMYRAEEPVPNLQHQPVILQAGVAPEAPAAPKLDAEM